MGAGAVGRSVAELAGGYGHEVVGIADSAGTAMGEPLDVGAALDRKARTGSVGDEAPETLLDADQPLSATEIADRAGTSRNAWYDNRDRLETAGLVENHGSAGYRIPPNSDAADAARDLRTAIEK